MKKQNFGIEIEFTGITRKTAAETLSAHFGTTYNAIRDAYDTYKIPDGQDRNWKIVRDASIRVEGGEQCELVSPICQYADIETIQELVRKLRTAGGKANNSCGIHIHINSAPHSAKSIRNIANIMTAKEDLIFKALQVDEDRARRFCKKVDDAFIEDINRKKPQTLAAVKNLWYNGNDGSWQHYHESRYHALNLHSVFQKGTIEFRMFNSTLAHAGKIKAYIQFCLAISHQALTQTSASKRKTKTSNDKYTFRTWLLRLGLIGDEFKTARLHLLANLEGNSAWRQTRAA
jgi:hypothetical protein